MIILALFAAASCDLRKESAKTEEQSPVQEVRKDITQDAREARMTPEQEMAHYREEARVKLEQFDENIKKIQQDTADKQKDAKYRKDMKDLKILRDTAAQKLAQLESGTMETWEKFKAEMDYAFTRLDEHFRYVSAEHGS